MMSLTEKLLLARLCYSLGVDYISNAEYDVLVFEQMNKDNPYLFFNSEDIPSTKINRLLQLGNELGLSLTEAYEKHLKTNAEQYKQDNIDKSKLHTLFSTAMSMQMANDMSLIINDYLKQVAMAYHGEASGTVDLHYAYKMDGWNIANYYVPDDKETVFVHEGEEYVQVAYSHSRGSDGATNTECTPLMRCLLPPIKRSELKDNVIYQVTGELTMRKECLSVLNQALGKDYSNVRNTISGFVKGTIPLEYSYMVQFNAFKVCTEGGSTLYSKSFDNYCWLHSHGFHVPTGNLVSCPTGATLEETYNNLVISFRQTFASFEAHYTNTVGQIFECDGLTVQPNDLSVGHKLKPIAVGNFGFGLLAIKAGVWYKKSYVSTVARIHFSKSRVSRAPIAIVVPVSSDLGQTLTTVPLLHVQNMIDHDVNKGDTIQFTYHSQQLVEFDVNLSAVERNRMRGLVSV